MVLVFFFFFFEYLSILKIFLMWSMFKVFIEFINNISSVLCFGFFGHKAGGNLNSPTRDRTHDPCIGRQSLNHWTAREILVDFT